MAQRRKQELAQRVYRVGKTINDHRGWSTVWGLWLLTNALSIGYRTISLQMLVPIYVFFAKRIPPQHSPSPWLPLWRWAYTQLLFWPIVGMIYLIYKFFTFRRSKPEVIAPDPIILYEREVSAAVLAIDTATDDTSKRQQMEDAIATLLDTVFQQMAASLRLTDKHFRMYLVVPKEDNKRQAWLSGLRVGRVFEEEKRGKISSDQFDELLEVDRSRVDTFLTEYDTTICVTKSQGWEKAVLLMARNPGKYLRMGLYIAITKPGAEPEDYKDDFAEAAAILPTLGFIDEIVAYVRQYGQEGS